jgi:DNA-binding IclR family transcriptional regulator
LCGLHKNKAQIQLKGSVIRAFGLNRYSCYRGLSQLEAAGLVSVERHTGRNPIVTILNGRESEGDGNES